MNKKILILVVIFVILAVIALCYRIFSINGLRESRRVDGIVEPVYTQDCFPRTLQNRGVTRRCFEHANLGQNIFCTKTELKLIKDYYQNGQDKDPLNNCSQDFCAEE